MASILIFPYHLKLFWQSGQGFMERNSLSCNQTDIYILTGKLQKYATASQAVPIAANLRFI